MDFMNELEQMNKIIDNIEKDYKENDRRLCCINETIDMLLKTIEFDTFNCAQGYNYTKMLKELLIKKRICSQLNFKYKAIFNPYNKKVIDRSVNKKKKELELRQYKPRIVKGEGDIEELLKDGL